MSAPAAVERATLAGGHEGMVLTAADGACLAIAHQGAHVVSWQPTAGDERLFLSAATSPRAGDAIRGGVPVIFPQFADRGPLGKHGFARGIPWALIDAGREAASGAALARYRLADSEATRARWPHRFTAELTARADAAALTLTLVITNTGDAPCTFTAALHTYLRVGDIGSVALHGLHGVRYLDSAAGGIERRDDDAVLRLDREVDRIYADAPATLLLREPTRMLGISQQGFRDTVVWNPWQQKGDALADLEPQGWRRFLCVESAAVIAPVALAPGREWIGRQTLQMP